MLVSSDEVGRHARATVHVHRPEEGNTVPLRRKAARAQLGAGQEGLGQ
jgi:hypothetical protein